MAKSVHCGLEFYDLKRNHQATLPSYVHTMNHFKAIKIIYQTKKINES